MATLLSRIDRLVNADPRRRSIRELRAQLRTPARDTRLVALRRILTQIKTTGLRDGYFHLVERLTIDSDSTCRWQATIIIGEFIETEPDRVWPVARKLGASRKWDVRAAAATVLLEHLLQHHPGRMSALFRAELKRGDPHFAAAVAMCWNFGRGQAKRRIQRIIDKAKRSKKAAHRIGREDNGLVS